MYPPTSGISNPSFGAAYTGANAAAGGAPGGGASYQLYGRQPQASPLTTQYDQYGNAVNQANQDYTSLMGQYKDLYNRMLSGNYASIPTPPTFNPVMPQWTQSGNVTSSLGDLANLAQTGGLSASDIADLRSRGISPIAATYANAQANIDRAKALGGGYAPNYIAATAKLARDQGQAVSQGTQDVNAQIAGMVQQGKLAAAPAYASAAGAADAAQRQYAEEKAGLVNQAGMMNLQNQMEAARDNAMLRNQMLFQNPMSLLDQMRSLYGTQPAQPALYGSQAQSGAELQQGFNQDAFNNLLKAYGVANQPQGWS